MMQNLEKDWRERVVKNNLDLIILRLVRSQPRWGYEVNTRNPGQVSSLPQRWNIVSTSSLTGGGRIHSRRMGVRKRTRTQNLQDH